MLLLVYRLPWDFTIVLQIDLPCRPTAMDERLRGFGSQTYTLIVGPGKEKLTVQEQILTTIPYFKTALSSSGFRESQTITFDLPEDDPQAVADVLDFTYTGTVAAILFNSEDSQQPELVAYSYLRAYIVADKFKAEVTANQLVDEVIRYHKGLVVYPGFLEVLGDAGLHDCALYKLLAQGMLNDLRENQYDRGFEPCSGEEKLVFDDMVQKLSKEDLLHIIYAAKGFKYEGTTDPITEASNDLCKYHKHDLTEKCTTTTPSREDAKLIS